MTLLWIPIHGHEHHQERYEPISGSWQATLSLWSAESSVQQTLRAHAQHVSLIWDMPKTHFRFMIHYCLQACRVLGSILHFYTCLGREYTGSFDNTGLHCGSGFAPLRHEPEHVAEVS